MKPSFTKLDTSKMKYTVPKRPTHTRLDKNRLDEIKLE